MLSAASTVLWDILHRHCSSVPFCTLLTMNKTSLYFAAVLLVTAVVTTGIVLMLQNVPNKPEANAVTESEESIAEPENPVFLPGKAEESDEPKNAVFLPSRDEEPENAPPANVVPKIPDVEAVSPERSVTIPPETELTAAPVPPVLPTPEVRETPSKTESVPLIPTLPIVADFGTPVAAPEKPITATKPVAKTGPAPEVKTSPEPVVLYPIYPVYPVYWVQNTRLVPMMPIRFPLITKTHLGRATLVYNNGVIITMN
jgi:hypothetical protein